MLRRFLKDIPPTEENKEMLNKEIERRKAEERVAYEEGYIKDLEEVRTKIAIILLNGK